MTKPRSVDQHRRFFAIMKAAYNHWPESHRFKPVNSEHLRAWLLVRAGHSFITTFDFGDDGDAVAKAVPIVVARMKLGHVWCDVRNGAMHVAAPRSIAFDKLGHHEFCKLNDDVDEVIRVETGLDPEALMRETEAAA